MDGQGGSFLFINKSTTSRTLSRSSPEEKTNIFRHVQLARSLPKHAVPANVPIKTLTTYWLLQGGDEEQGTETGDSSSKVKADGGTDLTAISGRDSHISRLAGDGFDPFNSSLMTTEYLPSAAGDSPHLMPKFRSDVSEYLRRVDLTEYARRERLRSAFTRPTIMLLHLTLITMRTEVTDIGLGKTVDQNFPALALRHARQEISNTQDHPWDLICLVSIFMFRALVIPRLRISQL